MKRKLTTGGIVLLAVGGILTLAGLALFLRAVLVLDPDLPDPLILPWWREINLEGGMLGLVLLVAGSYLVKIGLGLTLRARGQHFQLATPPFPRREGGAGVP